MTSERYVEIRIRPRFTPEGEPSCNGGKCSHGDNEDWCPFAGVSVGHLWCDVVDDVIMDRKVGGYRSGFTEVPSFERCPVHNPEARKGAL